MMNEVINDRQQVVLELADIPDKFIPFILRQVKAYKDSLNKKNKRTKSPAKRLLKLAGILDNSRGLSVKQYKASVVDEYVSHRL